jgi:cell division transport system permease protein
VSVVGYAFEEAWISLRRSAKSAIVSIGTIAIAFVTLGAFLLVSVNVQQALDRWLAAAELSVYLSDTATDEERAAIAAHLDMQPAVVASEFVSKERALERFRTDFPELAEEVSSLSENPFPSAFEVRLQTGASAEAEADELARSVAELDGVADVRYDRRWLARLLAIVTGAQVAGGIAASVLMLGAAFTVAAVVRLSLHARREELEIMKLVGAPLSYIRGPSIVEGLLLGGIGADVAFLALAHLCSLVEQWLGPDLAGLTGGAPLRFLGFREGAILLLGGLAVGAGAGALASRGIK